MTEQKEGQVPQRNRSVLDEQWLGRLIENRDIKQEDFPLLEELAEFPKEMFIELLHNHFNSYRERSLRELDVSLAEQDRLIERNQDNTVFIAQAEQNKKLLDAVKRFAEKYDWAVCYNMVRKYESRDE
ncbi:MAG: hypothetical protein ABIH21_02520 [Patescibacteria group bacterium]